ncbi:hypothetical protein GCM10009838_23240 [Catenulispora subtropica]|uniref:Transglycosylase SLT domain-containing protein n=2 Tax=Catenulispora subtropica TaxID=450798 RepID=A0ABN2R8G7_9ACTN
MVAFAALVAATTTGAAAATGPASGGARAKAPGLDHRSKDVAIQTSADENGYHIYAGLGSSGFAWRPLATLKPGDIDSPMWTGYSCMTGSGKHVVAVVAPADFANDPALKARGAFAYVVDVPSGAVHPVTAGVALTYYSPGCGAGDTAVLTRALGDDEQRTQLLTLDADRDAVTQDVIEPEQLSSAVPAQGGHLLAARGATVVDIDPKGTVKAVGKATGQVFDIVADAAGNASFLSVQGSDAVLNRLSKGTVTPVAHAGLSGTALHSARGGRAILVTRTLKGKVPADVATSLTTGLPDVVDSVSLDGEAVVGHTGRAAGAVAKTQVFATGTGSALPSGPDLGPAAAAVTATPATGYRLDATAATALTATAAQTPKCAVPRNDPTAQVPQPGKQQVERAVDLATTGQLNDQRPANYLNMGLPAYTASSNFAPHTLLVPGAMTTGPVPAQVFLGVLAQESNFNQASWHSLPGLSGNPLIADYYGSAGGISTINYAAADCGYGIAQVTTGMATTDTNYSANGKKKIAVDYEENIAAGLQILEDKWNTLEQNGLLANDGDPTKIENWYLALWAYNTGFHSNDGSNIWGLGWVNNPANPNFKPNRDGYLRDSYGDASHPADWPYQERVFGWIENPIHDRKGDPSYARPSYHTSSGQLQIPPPSDFCDVTDNCSMTDPSGKVCVYGNLPSTDPLYYHCWWHQPVNWVPDCASNCATQTLVFTATDPDPGVKNPHPADCGSQPGPGAVIVDELANPGQNVAGCTGMTWSNGGTFTLSYATDSSGNPIAAIDTHQIGAGFGGHAYFTHNRLADDPQHIVTGVWKANLPNHLYNVFAHMPSTGATSDFADYRVTQTDGSVKSSTVSQHTSQDQWVSLGYFPLSGNAQVLLDNVTVDGAVGAHDVAFDAIGFVPVAGTLVQHTFDSVAIFSENQNLDTGTPSQFNTPMRTMTTLYNWADAALNGGPMWNDPSQAAPTGLLQYPVCSPDAMSNGCIGAHLSAAAQAWNSQVQAAGSSPTDHPPGLSEATWMNFAVPSPAGTTIGGQFQTDGTFKIKNHVEVQYLTDTSGNLVPGSQWSSVQSRTGDTEIAKFVRDYVAATVADYGSAGVTMPDIGYQEIDANQFTGDATNVTNPLVTGYTPGRAYMPHTNAATLDGDCVQVRAINGGSIGYRPLDAKDSVDAAMNTWTDQLNAAYLAGRLPYSVYKTAVDIYAMFFQGGHDGSLFNNAPPIWQELGIDFCAGSTGPKPLITNNKDVASPQLVAQSYMPDLYLYYDGNMIGQDGKPATGPVQHGDFKDFSNIPVVNSIDGNPYDTCDLSDRGNGGNPWSINIWPIDFPDVRPDAVVDCATMTEYDDTTDNTHS